MDKKRSGSRPRRPNSKFITTRSGRSLKVNQSMGERWTARKDARSSRKAERMIGLPKSRFKRTLWRLHPKRLAAYWFSRDGGIIALKIVGIVIIALFILTLGVFAFFRKDLPALGKDISGSNLGGSISYYDRTGQTLLFADYNAIKRVPVKSEGISPYLKQATVAVEDKDFYKHRGFDIRGITRAAVNDLTHHSSSQGGSTITQQLVKLTQDWTQQRSIARKAKELILAVELERTYTKDEILTGYLNAAPYGGVIYGAQAASSDYFHKSAKDLTLAESAFLASIPKSPAVYSPYNKDYFQKTELTARSNYVLDQMVAQGKITKKQADDAKKVDVLAEVHPQQDKYAGIKAPYFVQAAKNEIYSQLIPPGRKGNKVGGWKVTTTLDLNLQGKAEQIIASNLPNVKRYGADEEALVLEDIKTGQIKALVGGTDFTDPDHGQINYANEAKIPPGSSFKPYDYATLIENRSDAGAGSVLYDNQTPLPGYPCTDKGPPPPKGKGNCLADYDFLNPGPLTLRYALGGSRNIPAVKAMLEALPNDTSDGHVNSINKVINTANSMMHSSSAYNCYSDEKLTQKTQCYAASAIGDGAFLHLDQHTNGLATMARMGNSIPLTYIEKIQDASSKPIYSFKQPKGTQAIRPESAYIVNNMASDPNASYLPQGYYKWHRYNGWNNAIKTGTTNNGYDGLMMSWNTQFAVGSWAGYHTRNKTLSGTMELLTTPMAKGMMTYALDSLHTQPVNWAEPPGLQHLPGFVVRNHVHYGDVEPSPTTELFPSWYKSKTASTQSVTLDRVSNKLATDCTPASAKNTLGGNASPNNFSIDIFYPPGHQASNSAANTAASDDVHSCSDTPPSVNLTATDNNDGTITISAFVRAGTHPFNDAQYSQFPGTLTINVNGQTVKTSGVSDPEDNISYTYSAPGAGSYSITATVTDSVLYSGSDSTTVNLASGGGGSPLAFLNVTANSASWSGGSGTYTITRVDNNQPLCSATAPITTCTFGSTTHNKQIRLSDSVGDPPVTATTP